MSSEGSGGCLVTNEVGSETLSSRYLMNSSLYLTRSAGGLAAFILVMKARITSAISAAVVLLKRALEKSLVPVQMALRYPSSVPVPPPLLSSSSPPEAAGRSGAATASKRKSRENRIAVMLQRRAVKARSEQDAL